MIEFNSNLQAKRPEEISMDYIEKAIIYTSFVIDSECPSLAFVVDDDGYVEMIPTDYEIRHTGYYLEHPFGRAGLPKGLKNMLIENEADFNDYKALLFEEYSDIEEKIEEAYETLQEYTEKVSLFSIEDDIEDLNEWIDMELES